MHGANVNVQIPDDYTALITVTNSNRSISLLKLSLFTSYVALYQQLGLDINESILEFIQAFPKTLHHYRSCLKELRKIKKIALHDKFTAIDLFTSEKRILKLALQNKTTHEKFGNIEWKCLFPIYGSIIRNKYNYVSSFSKREDQTIELFNGTALNTWIVRENIIKHLSYRDMRTIHLEHRLKHKVKTSFEIFREKLGLFKSKCILYLKSENYERRLKCGLCICLALFTMHFFTFWFIGFNMALEQDASLFDRDNLID